MARFEWVKYSHYTVGFDLPICSTRRERENTEREREKNEPNLVYLIVKRWFDTMNLRVYYHTLMIVMLIKYIVICLLGKANWQSKWDSSAILLQINIILHCMYFVARSLCLSIRRGCHIHWVVYSINMLLCPAYYDYNFQALFRSRTLFTYTTNLFHLKCVVLGDASK